MPCNIQSQTVAMFRHNVFQKNCVPILGGLNHNLLASQKLYQLTNLGSGYGVS